MTEDLISLFRFIPEAWRNRACIAGGYAAEPRLAGDIDLWVVAGNSHQAIAQHDVIKYLRHLGYAGNIRLRTTREDQGYSTISNLVATLPKAFDKRDVQILVTSASTFQELVDRFDISTHAVGTYLNGGVRQVVFGAGWTDLRSTPRVLRTSTPSDSLDRLERICERYNLVPDADEVHRLKLLADDELSEAA